MGFEIRELMKDRRSDYALKERFTSLESIVYPVIEPFGHAALQIFDIYEVQNARVDLNQVRLILSDSMYLQEAILASELIEGGKCKSIKKGSIVRILEYTLYAGVFNKLKRVIEIVNFEVIVVDFRLVGNPTCIAWEEWKEEDWDEGTWEWLDPVEELEDLDEPCGFSDITETITADAITQINNNFDAEQLPVIILQITDISSIDTSMEEFRIILSDGKHLQDAVLATGLNDKVRNNLAVRGSIVFLYEYNLLETVENRRIMFVRDMHVLEVNAEIVGNPKELPSGNTPLVSALPYRWSTLLEDRFFYKEIVMLALQPWPSNCRASIVTCWNSVVRYKRCCHLRKDHSKCAIE